MHLFYTPAWQNGYALLSEDESLHCAKVLRLQANEEILVTDGKGNMAKALLEVIHPKVSTARITDILQKAEEKLSNRYIHIAVAPTKNIERIEWFLEKASEIGIDEISLFFSVHSERNAVKMERLDKILISAMKQSQQAYLPKLNEAVKFTDFIKNMDSFEARQKFIAYCDNAYPKKALFESLEKPLSYLVLIGPEGDFSPEEVKLAVDKGFSPVSLGDTRLRTETAALDAVFAGKFKDF